MSDRETAEAIKGLVLYLDQVMTEVRALHFETEQRPTLRQRFALAIVAGDLVNDDGANPDAGVWEAWVWELADRIIAAEDNAAKAKRADDDAVREVAAEVRREDEERIAGLEEKIALYLSAARCLHCGKPATCVGEYETSGERNDFACDDCCGHGCEDGDCEPLKPDG